jgi:hypothetical protein
MHKNNNNRKGKRKMSTRKTTSERIDLHKEKMEQMQNEMKRLKRLHNAEERKTRNHRICRRGAHMESLLPDTIGLSDERFYAFLEKTVANDFGRRALAALKAEQEKEDGANIESDTAGDGGTAAGPATAESAQGGKPSALKSAAPKRSDSEGDAEKPAQTPAAPNGVDGGKTGNGTKGTG